MEAVCKDPDLVIALKHKNWPVLMAQIMFTLCMTRETPCLKQLPSPDKFHFIIQKSGQAVMALYYIQKLPVYRSAISKTDTSPAILRCIIMFSQYRNGKKSMPVQAKSLRGSWALFQYKDAVLPV